MSSISTPFSRYDEALRGVAEAWVSPTHTTTPGSAATFEDTGRVLHRRTIEVGKDLEAYEEIEGSKSIQALDTASVEKGILVPLRFMFHAAHVARQEGLSLEELSARLLDPRSYSTNLGIIANQQIEVAKRAEGFAGVATALSMEDLEARARYLFTHGTHSPSYVAIAGLAADIFHERRTPRNEYEARPDARCAMERAGFNGSVFQSVARVALRDPLLIPTIVSGQETLPNAAELATAPVILRAHE